MHRTFFSIRWTQPERLLKLELAVVTDSRTSKLLLVLKPWSGRKLALSVDQRKNLQECFRGVRFGLVCIMFLKVHINLLDGLAACRYISNLQSRNILRPPSRGCLCLRPRRHPRDRQLPSRRHPGDIHRSSSLRCAGHLDDAHCTHPCECPTRRTPPHLPAVSTLPGTSRITY